MLAAVRRRLVPFRPGALPAAFSAANATPPADPALSYLVSSCGLSPTAAAQAAPSVRLASPRAAAQADAVLALLRRYGFSEAEIFSVVRKLPILLNANAAKTLQPRLDFLASVGIEAPLLQRLVLVNPFILYRGVKDRLEPLFATLREVLGSDARVVAALKRLPFVTRCNPESTLFRTLPLLREVHGLSAADLSKLVALQPGVILLSSDRINEIVGAARKVGIEPGNPMFVHVLRALCTMKAPTLERKVELYRRLGFHKDDVTLMIRRYPHSFMLSEKMIAEKVGFLTDKAGLTQDDIVTYPTLLTRSLEAHSRRCAVLSVLRRAGKQPQRNLPTLLVWGEKRFLEYVRPHVEEEEVPNLLQAMNGEIPFQGFDSVEEKPKLPRKKMSA